MYLRLYRRLPQNNRSSKIAGRKPVQYPKASTSSQALSHASTFKHYSLSKSSISKAITSRPKQALSKAIIISHMKVLPAIMNNKTVKITPIILENINNKNN